MRKKGDYMDEKLTEIAVKIGRMDTTINAFIKQQEKQHKEIHTTLNGNGKRGLKGDMDFFKGMLYVLTGVVGLSIPFIIWFISYKLN